MRIILLTALLLSACAAPVATRVSDGVALEVRYERRLFGRDLLWIRDPQTGEQYRGEIAGTGPSVTIGGKNEQTIVQGERTVDTLLIGDKGGRMECSLHSVSTISGSGWCTSDTDQRVHVVY